MTGSLLYPLNTLKVLYPTLYQSKVKKYDDRTQLLKHRLPVLGCLWNDVIFLTAVHPAKIHAALVEAGFGRTGTLRSFQFEARHINARKSLVLLEKEGVGRVYDYFDPRRVDEYDLVPDATTQYHHRQKRLGKRTMVVPYIPHILYQGTLDITGVPIVEG